jgi:coenzyme F420-0:L-glutamate ligase / coenzyme F420-1:gamma-L-glutamate ligase
MEMHEFLRGRRSIRRFTHDLVELNVVERILETATRAPSAHNRQPWRFAVITNPLHRLRLADAMAAEFARDLDADGTPIEQRESTVERSRQRIISAPAAIVLCMEWNVMDRYPDERRTVAERTMAIQSVANAGTTLLLAAHAEGLGGVWICAPLFAQEAVIRALALPATWEPQALLLVGKPAEIGVVRPRRGVHEVAVFQ